MPEEMFLTGVVAFVLSYSVLSQVMPGDPLDLPVSVLLSMAAALGVHFIMERTVFKGTSEEVEQPSFD